MSETRGVCLGGLAVAKIVLAIPKKFIKFKFKVNVSKSRKLYGGGLKRHWQRAWINGVKTENVRVSRANDWGE